MNRSVIPPRTKVDSLTDVQGWKHHVVRSWPSSLSIILRVDLKMRSFLDHFWEIFQPFNRQPAEIHDFTKSFDIYDERSQTLILYFVHNGFVRLKKGWISPSENIRDTAYQFDLVTVFTKDYHFIWKSAFLMRKIWLRKVSLVEYKNHIYLYVHQNLKNRTVQLRVQTFKFFWFRTSAWRTFQSSKNTYLTSTCISIMF